MILYHGTWEDNFKEINKCGYIDNFKVSETTEELDNILNKILLENIREGAIYLTDDFSCVKYGYDNEFKILVSNLNTNLLMIADNRLADKVFCAYYDGNEESLIKAVKEYQQSLINYEDFLEKEKEIRQTYGSLEFLYFDKIKLTTPTPKGSGVRLLREQVPGIDIT